MADVKYVVAVDSAGAVTQIRKLDEAWEQLGKSGASGGAEMEKAAAKSSALWKQFAVGQMATNAAMKGLRELKQAVTDVIAAAIAQEEADNALRASLELTGRSVQGNYEHYREFAASMQKATVYGDEQVQAVQNLLIQMTRLDQEGIDRATKGAAGLASTLGMDLQSAAMLVQKAVEGNTGALSRYGIRIDENLSKEEKTEAVLAKLEALYGRATAEVGTFGGSVKQLRNLWGDLYEELGSVITQNEGVRTGIKDLAEGLAAFIASDRFKLWLSSITEVITAVVKGLGAIGKAVVDIEEKLFGAKGWEKYVGDAVQANAVTQQGVSIIALRRKAIDGEIMTVREWGEAFKKNGGTARAMIKAIAEGREGPELRKIFDDMKAGVEAAAAAAAAAKPPIDEVGNGIAAAAAHAQALKDELKLVFADEQRAQLAKYREALALFQNRLSPAQAEDLRKKIGELEAQFAGAAAEADQVDLVLASLGITTIPQAYAQTAVLEKAMARLNRMYAEGKIDLLEYGRQQAKLNEELEKNRVLVEQKLPPANEEWQRVLREAAKSAPGVTATMTRSMAEKWAEFGEKASAAMEKVQQVWGTVSSSMTAVVQQAQKNREIAIENEYKKRLAAINRTVKDEDKKNAAIEALEAEYQIKRTRAQAAGAKQAKAIALMEAVVNTASGVARAFKDYAFPFSAVIAGIVGALGAIQIAMIAKQPIPLARGAVFKRPTIMTTSEGATYEVGEEGTEYLVPEKHLAPFLGRAGTGLVPAWAGAGGSTININSPLVQTTGLSNADLEAAGSRLYAIMQRQARRRGGR